MAKEYENDLTVITDKNNKPAAVSINPRLFSMHAIKVIILRKIITSSIFNTTFIAESDEATWYLLPHELLKAKSVPREKRGQFIQEKAGNMAYSNRVIIISSPNRTNMLRH